jgi:type IV secretory pathway TrbD component
VAKALLPGAAGEPRTGGDAAARQWIWGPESGSAAAVAGEPVRLWICAEQAYGDRLWAVATLVRRAGDDED